MVKDNNIFSTTDTELAAWLMSNGVILNKVIHKNGLPSIMLFENPNQIVTQLSVQFYAWDGDAQVARSMFKSYKKLLRKIKGV